MGLLSWFQSLQDNYLSINYKAEFARFKEKYRNPWIDSEICGNRLEDLIDRATKNTIKATRKAKSWDKKIDFTVNTYNLIRQYLWISIENGKYAYRGVPAFETELYVRFYKKLVHDAQQMGMCSVEEANNLIEVLKDMVEENG